MKLTIVFLAICVAISQQQYYHPRMMMGYPWMAPSFARQPMFFNNHMVYLTVLNSTFSKCKMDLVLLI